jgi:hypothetical protein
MANYAAEMNRTSSTTASVGSWVADATRPRRLKLYQLVIGASATPADATLEWTVTRCTAAGTSTAVTPQPLDPADAATESDAGENHTVEPTYTAATNMLTLPVNQRATYTWSALSENKMIVTPATASNGFGLQTDTISTGTPAVSAVAHVEEQ